MFDQLLVSSAACARTRVSRTLPMAALLHATALAVIVSIPLMFPAAIPQEVGRFLAEVTHPYAPPIVVPAPPSGNPNPGPPRQRPPAPPDLDPNGLYIPPVFPDNVPPPSDKSWKELFGNGNKETGDGDGIGFVPGELVEKIPLEARSAGSKNLSEALSPPVRPEPPRRREAVPPKVLLSKLVCRVEPVYPEIAIRSGIHGTVVIRVVVDETGRVAEAQVMSGDRILAAAAESAVRQWVYSPTLVGGRPISIVGVVSVSFTLNR